MTTPDALAPQPAAMHGSARRWPVDPEHGLLRLAVILTFIASGVGTYILVNLLFRQIEFINLIGIVVAVITAVVLTRMVESGLKRRWPSGRYAEIDGAKIRLGEGDAITREIDGMQHVNVLTWRFTVSRRARVPKGWYVVALALMQDDLYLPLYTFMSPEEFDAMPLASQFPALAAPKQPEQSDLRLAGQQRRLRTAEYARWNEGAELSREHFQQVIVALQQTFPGWMISE